MEEWKGGRLEGWKVGKVKRKGFGERKCMEALKLSELCIFNPHVHRAGLKLGTLSGTFDSDKTSN